MRVFKRMLKQCYNQKYFNVKNFVWFQLYCIRTVWGHKDLFKIFAIVKYTPGVGCFIPVAPCYEPINFQQKFVHTMRNFFGSTNGIISCFCMFNNITSWYRINTLDYCLPPDCIFPFSIISFDIVYGDVIIMNAPSIIHELFN